MEALEKPWRLHVSGYTRAFVRTPRSFRLRGVLFLRGWRAHLYGDWWTKPGPKQARLEGTGQDQGAGT